MAMDYLMDVVEPKSFIGRCLTWVTEKFERCIKLCKSAMINGWKYCKNKIKEACTCSSNDDNADQCVEEPESFIGRCWKWVTEKFERCIKLCKSAMINGWKYCKNKAKESYIYCFRDRYVL